MKKRIFLLLLTLFSLSKALYARSSCCFPCHRLDYPDCCRCHNLAAAGWWGEVDYMVIWRSKRFLPALVTTSPIDTPLEDIGILGLPTTTVLFGNTDIGKSPQSGVRGDAGIWLTRCFGAGGSIFAVGSERVNYDNDTRGGAIIARPFFDTSSGVPVPAREIVADPIFNPIGGIHIDTNNSFCGGDLYARYNFFGTTCFKFDILGGFLYTTLRDSLKISTQSQSELLFQTNRSDEFDATNNYYAGLVGFYTELRSSRWAVQCTGKVGLGNMVESVKIKGSTDFITPDSVSTIFPGGLLALPTNIGVHRKHRFEVVPQLYTSIQLRVWCNLWLTAGYIVYHWPKVALVGADVDLNVNPTQQDGGILDGPPDPRFHIHDRSFTAHGATVGALFKF